MKTLFVIFIIVSLIITFEYIKSYGSDEGKAKGRVGEKIVRKELRKLPNSYIIMNDLLIECRDETTQIDHVVISSKGIFVIETKNISGNIQGDDNTKYWTQVLDKYNRRNKFYSPVWQNKTHVKAIKYKFRHMNNIPVYSIIVFSDQCNLKRVKSDNIVIHIKDLNKNIKRIKSQRILSYNEIKEIEQTLRWSNIKSYRRRKQHINMVKKKR
ncbi:MAG: NERD domain-containing protein [Clostridium sp.]|nr:NERD domain-containing protein [Clostridium sp.]